MQIIIQTSGFELVRKAFSGMDQKVQLVVRSNFTALGYKGVSVMKRVLEFVKATGAEQQSVKFDFDEKALEVRVFPTARHAIFTRTGTRPHWAPIAPLKLWAALRFGDESVAYAIQRNIAKFGTSQYLVQKGHPFNEQTQYGMGLNFPKATLSQGDMQSSIHNTARRLGIDLVAMIEKTTGTP